MVPNECQSQSGKSGTLSLFLLSSRRAVSRFVGSRRSMIHCMISSLKIYQSLSILIKNFINFKKNKFFFSSVTENLWKKWQKWFFFAIFQFPWIFKKFALINFRFLSVISYHLRVDLEIRGRRRGGLLGLGGRRSTRVEHVHCPDWKTEVWICVEKWKAEKREIFRKRDEKKKKGKYKKSIKSEKKRIFSEKRKGNERKNWKSKGKFQMEKKFSNLIKIEKIQKIK